MENNLEKILTKKGITFYALANACGTSVTHAYGFKRSVPRMELALKIAKFLNMPVEEIWVLK